MNRKEAIRAYKDRKIPRGVFAVRCAATGEVWVGSSPNLDAAENSLWFGLRAGSHIHRTMQSAWNRHAGESFQFEIVERLDDDLAPMAVTDLLKEKKRLWAAELGASVLL